MQTRKISSPRQQQPQQQQQQQQQQQKSKECPPEKILNPNSGRCVNKTSKLGKSILAKL